MRPYYEHGLVRIYHVDFREVLASLGVQADCILADPPYGQTSLSWDVWPPLWPSAIAPYLKPSGSMWCFGSLRMFMDHASEFTPQWRMSQDIVWEKHNGSGFHADRFKRVHEQAVHFYPSYAPWEGVYHSPVMVNEAVKKTVRNRTAFPHTGAIGSRVNYTTVDGGPKLMRSVIYARSCHGTAVNETQKPIDIVAPLIEYACPPGGLIVEPFGGSAPAALIAAATGRSAIVCDVREEQCERAAIRVAGGRLFLKDGAARSVSPP